MTLCSYRVERDGCDRLWLIGPEGRRPLSWRQLTRLARALCRSRQAHAAYPSQRAATSRDPSCNESHLDSRLESEMQADLARRA